MVFQEKNPQNGFLNVTEETLVGKKCGTVLAISEMQYQLCEDF